MEELQDLLDEARALGKRAEEAAALYGMGRIYFKEGLNEAAEDFWCQCVAVCREQQLVAELGQVILELGDLAARMNATEQARERYLEALGLYRENGLLNGEAKALERLSALAGDLGLADEALDYLRTGLELCQANDDHIGSIYFLEQIIPLLRVHKATAEAEQSYRRLITLAEKVGDRDRMAMGLVGLADLYEQTGPPAEALPYLTLAHDIYIHLGKVRESGLIRQKIDSLG
jgi:tetratricopeptide (TPR) repeat protein